MSDRSVKGWPKSWKLPEDASAIIFYGDGSISAQIPKQEEYAPESPGMLACVCMIATSHKMRAWRTRFVAKQFREAKTSKRKPKQR